MSAARPWSEGDLDHLRNVECTTTYDTLVCDRAADHIRDLEAQLERECGWYPEDDECSEDWYGSCGAYWVFTAGGPIENEVNFCPNCGGKVRILPDELDAALSNNSDK